MIVFDKVNPNLSRLADYFEKKTKRFFGAGSAPLKDYFEDAACYNCKSDSYNSEFYDRYNFRHTRCSACGMVYVNPRLKEAIAHNLYSEDDYTQYYKIKLLPALDYRRNVLAVNKYKQIREQINKDNGKVLDIGCGLGEMLSVFKDNGWDALGVEFNSFAADYARKHFGIKVWNQSIYEFQDTERYDVIMLWGVLEHLYNPNKILDKCHKLLNTDGLLVIEVPSADSFLVRYAEHTGKKMDRIIEGDRHLMLFSALSLKEILAKSRFTPKALISNGLDIATVNRLFAKDILPPESVNMLQGMLDESAQGDLLRGFFTKKA